MMTSMREEPLRASEWDNGSPTIPESSRDNTRNGVSRGPGSFCIARCAAEALLDAKATAYEICTYLVLARFTDSTNWYSSASISAVNRATGANKVKGGPVDRAIRRLKEIHAKRVTTVSNGLSGASHAMVEQVEDLGPILVDRNTWLERTGEILPDGPTERGLIRYVLPELGEAIEGKVWFGNNLVSGVGGFGQPLKVLKNAGDEAARLLLALYMANDMEVWGGVRPVGLFSGPWIHYEPVSADIQLQGTARLIRAKSHGLVVLSIDKRISEENSAYWTALTALESAGLIYEVVMVLNKSAAMRKFTSGKEGSGIPAAAEPLYELDTRSKHGFKPEGEEGLGGVTARTAGELEHPVARHDGSFESTYAAIVPEGFPAMIAGIFRLRFRVANPKNVGVKGTWARIRVDNRDAFQFIQRVRTRNGLAELPAPWEQRQTQLTEPELKIPF
jgi:hypothetical protein